MAIPAVFYNGVWVSEYARNWGDYKAVGDMMILDMMKVGYKRGQICEMARSWLDIRRDIMIENSVDGPCKCRVLWGDDIEENVGRWVSFVHILLRLKAIKDDEANGFGFR